MSQPFSVLLPVYLNDNPQHFRTAVESISIKQTLQPDEVLVYVDGPVLEELRAEILKLSNEIPYIKVFWGEKKSELGTVLAYGMEQVKNELVARMDADDISRSDRFERLMSCFTEDEELDIVGSNISEFVGTPDNITGKRVLPVSHEDICSFMRKRNAMNHMSVMMRRSAVLSAGNYRQSFRNEDYFLWIRMMENGCKFRNIPDCLVNVRVGKDFIARRGGWTYFWSEVKLQRYMHRHGLISNPRFLLNALVRLIVQVVLPDNLRGFIFRVCLRKR